MQIKEILTDKDMTNNDKDRTHWDLNFNLDEEIIEYVDLLTIKELNASKLKILKTKF